jgi:hypothetical protein
MRLGSPDGCRSRRQPSRAGDHGPRGAGARPSGDRRQQMQKNGQIAHGKILPTSQNQELLWNWPFAMYTQQALNKIRLALSRQTVIKPQAAVMKIYISSTYQDLAEHRAAVDRTLRRMGHDVIGMEQYVAEGNKPLARCLADIRVADIYVVIVGWRYGYIPADQPSPLALSITELEYLEAVKSGKPVLAFLLDPESPWPLSRVDAMGTDPNPGGNISRFRSLLGMEYLAGVFRTPDDLASQAAAAVAAHGLNRFMVDRVLVQTSVRSGDMGAFGEGSVLFDSHILSIKAMVAQAGSTRAFTIDLGLGDQWWSTRLFLLSSLLQPLSGVRQLVFRGAHDRFCGMASPGAVIDRFGAAFPLCAEFLTQIRKGEASSDTERETDRQIAAWTAVFEPPTGPGERSVKVGVRAELLDRWLGERLVTRCIRVDQQGLTMAQVQQIVDSLLPDVPVERVQADGKRELQVVDRDAFALELAREWVRTGIPRNPVR